MYCTVHYKTIFYGILSFFKFSHLSYIWNKIMPLSIDILGFYEHTENKNTLKKKHVASMAGWSLACSGQNHLISVSSDSQHMWQEMRMAPEHSTVGSISQTISGAVSSRTDIFPPRAGPGLCFVLGRLYLQNQFKQQQLLRANRLTFWRTLAPNPLSLGREERQ